jgi:hypothetical protein
VTITLPANVTANVYYKYGHQVPDDLAHLYQFNYNGTTGATFSPGPNNNTIITLHFVDGELGDDDLTANGVIVDPGAPGMAGPTLTTFHQKLVAQFYTDLLHRTVDPTGLTTFSDLLDQGVSAVLVADFIEGSAEYKADLVTNLYTTYLSRQPDAAGVAYWVNFLLQGGTVEDLKVAFLGSTEFFARAGGTDQGFLTALYSAVLGRAIDSASAQSFETLLSQGFSVSQIAAIVVKSNEAMTDQVESDYEALLGRAGETAGVQHWVTALELGATDEMVIADFLGSAEFASEIQ